jgi:hypothetical protein
VKQVLVIIMIDIILFGIKACRTQKAFELRDGFGKAFELRDGFGWFWGGKGPL